MSKSKTIKLDLPDHSKELQESEDYIKNLKLKLEDINRGRKMSDKEYSTMFENISRGLYYVGSLSQPAFEVEEEIEQFYFREYKNTPELARKLWQDKYGEIHHPYNILKNRLFRLYEELDAMYKKINKSQPPRVLENDPVIFS